MKYFVWWEWFEIVDNSWVWCTVLDERTTWWADWGLTVIENEKLMSLENPPSQILDDYKADVSNLSADVNIVEVKWVPVTNIDDFKATTVIASNMRGTDNANTVIPDNTWINTKLDSVKSDTWYQERMVFIDTELIVVWDWTSKTPYNNIWDALDYAEANWIRKIIILSDITLDRQLKNFIIEWVGTPVIDCNWQNLDKSEFSRVMMNWLHLWRIVVQEAVLMNWFTLYWFFEKCALWGDLVCIGDTLLANCFSNIAGLARPSLSVDWHKVSIRNYSWWIEIRNCNSVLSEVTLELTWKAYLTNTCTLGIISVRWNATLDDQSNWSTVDISALLNQELSERVARASLKIVWTQLIAEDNLWEIQRWNLSDVSDIPSNENVFTREIV